MNWYLALMAASAVMGCAAIAQGSRTAIPLMASFCLSTTMCVAGFPFNLAVWLVIDIMAAAAILAAGAIAATLSPRDLLIVGLFVPVWSFYPDIPHDTAAGLAVMVIVFAQFFIAFRWKSAAAWLRDKAKNTAEPPGLLAVCHA